MKKLILIASSLCLMLGVNAQKFWTQNAQIDFHSEASLEKIEATNKQVSSVLDTETGDFAFSLLMKAFLFDKALMQEHFNEKYVESVKYPKASFKGTIENFDKLNKSSKEAQKVTVKGTLTMHGVSQEITTTGLVTFVDERTIKTSANFEIQLSDYKISIPSVVKDNISETIKINVLANLLPYEK